MNILLLGGTGVLSTDIAKYCIERHDSVAVVNRGNNTKFLPSTCKTILCDIRDTARLREQTKGLNYDVVVDFLSYNKQQLRLTYDVFGNRCKQYIFISSSCVFERKVFPINEDSPKPNIDLPYGRNKYECEIELDKISKNYACNYTIVRPYITYGDTRIPFGISPRMQYHWTLIGRILSGKPFFIWDDGVASCSLLHTSDFAKIFYNLLLNEKAYNTDINLADEKVYSWREMIQTLYSCLNKGNDIGNIISIPSVRIAEELPEYKDFVMADRSLNAIFDISKLESIVPEAKNILANRKSLEEGMRQTIQYYKSNNYLGGVDYTYDAKIDRMLLHVLPENSPHRKKIRYIDYLEEKKLENKVTYYLNLRFSRKTVHIINRIRNLFK